MIIDEIYDGLTDDEAFAAIPQQLATLVNGRSSTVFGVDARGELGFMLASKFYSSSEIEFFRRIDGQRKEPFEALVRQRGLVNRMLPSTHLMSPDAFLNSTYYDELYRPIGDDVLHFLVGKMEVRGGYCGVSIQRSRSADPFSDVEAEIIQVLAPHLRRTLDVRAALGTTQACSADLLDVVGRAVVVTDSAGRLLLANRESETLLDAVGPLTARNGILRARDAAANARLHDLIAAAGLGRASHGGAMLLQIDAARRLRVVVAPWRRDWRTCVIIVIDDPAAQDPSLTSKLTGLYGLTTAEAEITAALAEGHSPAEVADLRGVSLATVRSQIHQALRKSDARSLADLVRLAATLPRLGP